MTGIDYYDSIRYKLRAGQLGAPKHKLILEFLKTIWNEEEVRLLNHFEGVGKLQSPRKIAKKAGMEKDKVKEILDKLANKGTILKVGNQYALLPIAPGIIEFYILRRDDTEENLQKIAKIFSDMIDKIFPQWLITMKTSLLRPKLPVEAEEKIINIDKIIESGSQVLPYELVVEMINKNDFFAKLPCVCRLIGEYSDNPCKVASPELGCLVAGLVAKIVVQEGMGTELTKDEAIDYLKRAEKAGLVHNGANSSGPITYMLICNCCTCHCGFLRPQAKFGAPGTKRSNFSPKINNDLCSKCETCVKKCPMSALFHHYPLESDESDDYILFKEITCIGCGVCAANCPNNAIMMEKIRDDAVPEQLKLGDKSALEVIFG